LSHVQLLKAVASNALGTNSKSKRWVLVEYKRNVQIVWMRVILGPKIIFPYE
jgi:hypothetical protein